MLTHQLFLLSSLIISKFHTHIARLAPPAFYTASAWFFLRYCWNSSSSLMIAAAMTVTLTTAKTPAIRSGVEYILPTDLISKKGKQIPFNVFIPHTLHFLGLNKRTLYCTVGTTSSEKSDALRKIKLVMAKNSIDL